MCMVTLVGKCCYLTFIVCFLVGGIHRLRFHPGMTAMVNEWRMRSSRVFISATMYGTLLRKCSVSDNRCGHAGALFVVAR